LNKYLDWPLVDISLSADSRGGGLFPQLYMPSESQWPTALVVGPHKNINFIFYAVTCDKGTIASPRLIHRRVSKNKYYGHKEVHWSISYEVIKNRHAGNSWTEYV
jgi:hypothetical protein